VSQPPKFNEDRAERVLEAIKAGATRRAAAGHAGIDEDTLQNWRRRYSGFSEAIARAEHDVEVRCTATILKASNDDWRAASWWLERRRPAEYARRFEPEALTAAAVLQVTVAFDRPHEDDTLALADACRCSP
jgi:transposase-like protein